MCYIVLVLRSVVVLGTHTLVVSHEQVSCASGLRIFYACSIFISLIENNMIIKWQYLSSKNLEQTILFYFILEVNLMMTLATGGSCN